MGQPRTTNFKSKVKGVGQECSTYTGGEAGGAAEKKQVPPLRSLSLRSGRDDRVFIGVLTRHTPGGI